MTLTRSTLVAELLREYWSNECAAVGPTNVEDIAEGDVEFKSSQGGSNMALESALAILAAAAAFINHSISIWKALKQKKSTDPSSEDIESEMKDKELEPDKIDRELLNKVYEAICKELQNRDPEEISEDNSEDDK